MIIHDRDTQIIKRDFQGDIKVSGVLCFNGPVQQDINNRYYSNLLSEEFLDKYLQICGTLKIATRIKHQNIDMCNSGHHLVSDDRVSFVECPDYTTPKQVLTNGSKLRHVLSDTLDGSDILFVRVSGSIPIEAVKIAKRLGVTCLVEVVTCARDVYWNHSIKGKIVMPYMYYQMKKAVRDADFVQYITAEFLQSRYPTKGKSFVCSNALIEPMDENQLKNRVNRYKEPLRNRTIHLATTGTLSVAYKGQGDVVKAIRLLVNRGYDIVYHLIGDGDTERIRKIAEENNVLERIDFVGSIKHYEVHSYLDTMDLYIQPSWAEAQGRSLIEALSRGLPCSCSNVGGMVELVESDYVFSKKNAENIADVLEKLILSDLPSVCVRNYNKSLDFEKEKLAKKRREIFAEVALARK